MQLARTIGAGAVVAALLAGPHTVSASSHMDAPLITFDDAANTTDVYAFVDEDAYGKRLVLGLSVYPFEEPGIGPNKYNFDDNVLYAIHLALGKDVAQGRTTLSYEFEFSTKFQNEDTILQSFALGEDGVVDRVDIDNPDPDQNLVQRYRVTKVDHRRRGQSRRVFLGEGIVPPNNQGRVTPFYNQDDFGDAPAKDGVAREADLDPYTRAAIAPLYYGYRAFAGQRDDGFYANIQGVFDLLALGRQFDSQGGFNLHMMALEVPVSELGGDQQVVGVHATTSRQRITVLSQRPERKSDRLKGGWVQVARQGNPLFNEALVAIADKDLYSRTSPERDGVLFRKYAESPELAKLLNAVIVPQFGLDPAVESDRTDIAAIYIPDTIKVDLSTPGVCFAGGGPDHPTNPDDECFSRLSVFGNDLLPTTIEGHPFNLGGVVPGGWPNGRRFGDDVLDIAISALLSDLRDGVDPSKIQVVGDGIDVNDIAFSKVFPYEPTPHNGRVHGHHGEEALLH